MGARFILFNGDAFDYDAVLESTGKSTVAKIVDQRQNNSESPIQTHLLQAISRSDRMDYSIQKAVELGVSQITPVISARSSIKLGAGRISKKILHWQKIAISACEQSGRAVLPEIHPAEKLNNALNIKSLVANDINFVLDPGAQHSLSQVNNVPSRIGLLVGPESGLTEDEREAAELAGFYAISLGPRVLRTETAGPALLSIIQYLFGDMATRP